MPKQGAASRLYWRIATKSKMFFCYTVAIEITTVLLFEIVALLIGPRLFEGGLKGDIWYVVQVGFLGGVCYIARNATQILGFHAVKTVVIRGQRDLVKRLERAILNGKLSKDKFRGITDAARIMGSWERVASVSLLQLIAGAVSLSTQAVILALSAPEMLIPVIVLGFAFWASSYTQGKKINSLAQDEVDKETKVQESLGIMVENHEMYWIVNQVRSDLWKKVRAFEKASRASYRCNIREKARLRWVEFLAFCCIVGYVLYKMNAPDYQPVKLAGAVFILMVILNSLGSTIINLSINITDVRSLLGESERLCRILNEPVNPRRRLRRLLPPYSLVIRGVTKHGVVYPDVTLKPGVYVWPQPSEWGKTTLFKMMAGVTLPDSGEIRLNGRSSHRWDIRPYALLVAQSPVRVWMRTWYLFARATEAGMRYALTLTGVSLKNLKPHLMEESGGKAELLFITGAFQRAHRQPPAILLLDEPTTGLDASKAERLIKGILQFHKDFPHCIICIASHDTRLWEIGKLCMNESE